MVGFIARERNASMFAAVLGAILLFNETVMSETALIVAGIAVPAFGAIFISDVHRNERQIRLTSRTTTWQKWS